MTDLSEKNDITARIENILNDGEPVEEGLVTTLKALGGKAKKMAGGIRDWGKRNKREAKVISRILADSSMRRKIERMQAKLYKSVESEVSDWLDSELEDMKFSRDDLRRDAPKDIARMVLQHFTELPESTEDAGNLTDSVNESVRFSDPFIMEEVKWGKPFVAGRRGNRKPHVAAELNNRRDFEKARDIILKRLGHPDDFRGVDSAVTWENAGEARPDSDDGWTWEMGDEDYIYIANNPPMVGGTIEALRNIKLYTD